MTDKIFVDGMIVKAPREGSPDFIKCQISIKRKDLGNWLRGQTEDWINVDVKESREGKYYAEVNTWKPKQENKPGASVPASDYDDSDIPFN